jgi:heme/copper-type cytochrome/quinol oxidase subunit 4
MIGFLEILFQVSGIVLLVCAMYYYFHFKKIKRERKMTAVELTVFVVTRIAFLLLGSSYLLLLLDKHY